MGCSSQSSELTIGKKTSEYSQEEIEQVIKEWNESKEQIKRLLQSENDLNKLITLLAAQQPLPSSDALLNGNPSVVSHHAEDSTMLRFYAELTPRLTRTAAEKIVLKLNRLLPSLNTITGVSVKAEQKAFGERFFVQMGPLESNRAASMLCKILEKYNEKCRVIKS
ncbi:hypothetical protein [Pseudoalteromonas peptidolytica]|uniref:SPOR domain-containing protein n=1 Tax=Pseudoalteromonas peptidolytica F12-50-A1 TaxID=1315280 RepID=A0A8I0MW17_9GAMM|nr:hypothetical protein [Pseudoalteromonas peptidolytica]MBE0346927.1 hypothetical protein [Pseudoalteromonas peptidolytica F12-50-A1]NLR13989.1 hypothetical protein [Pseudoalteromonas peptidolytica]GEK11152.1 hypothetical protein PPE03_34010 [Pseudoalteromonas peptidolytica]